MKQFCAVVFLLVSLLMTSSASYEKYVIDAEKNAQHHNNMGVSYMGEGFYYGAIKEFKMAIDLNPHTQATSVYYNNLGRVYMIIGYSQLAQSCFERALIQNPMDFGYYRNLVTSFKNQHKLVAKLTEYSKQRGRFSNIIVIALIKIELGQVEQGKAMLSTLIANEKNLLITTAIKNYLSQI